MKKSLYITIILSILIISLGVFYKFIIKENKPIKKENKYNLVDDITNQLLNKPNKNTLGKYLTKEEIDDYKIINKNKIIYPSKEEIIDNNLEEYIKLLNKNQKILNKNIINNFNVNNYNTIKEKDYSIYYINYNTFYLSAFNQDLLILTDEILKKINLKYQNKKEFDPYIFKAYVKAFDILNKNIKNYINKDEIKSLELYIKNNNKEENAEYLKLYITNLTGIEYEFSKENKDEILKSYINNLNQINALNIK